MMNLWILAERIVSRQNRTAGVPEDVLHALTYQAFPEDLRTGLHSLLAPLRLNSYCALRGRRNLAGVLCHDSTRITRLWSTPRCESPFQFGIGNIDAQFTFFQVEDNHVAFTHGCDWTAGHCFGSHVSRHQAVRCSGKTAVG